MATYNGHIIVVIEVDDTELASEEQAQAILDDSATRIKHQMGAVTEVYVGSVKVGKPHFGL